MTFHSVNDQLLIKPLKRVMLTISVSENEMLVSYLSCKDVCV